MRGSVRGRSGDWPSYRDAMIHGENDIVHDRLPRLNWMRSADLTGEPVTLSEAPVDCSQWGLALPQSSLFDQVREGYCSSHQPSRHRIWKKKPWG
jgi:hypothetical protein